MGGPGASVVFKTKLPGDAEDVLRSAIRQISNASDGDEFVPTHTKAIGGSTAGSGCSFLWYRGFPDFWTREELTRQLDNVERALGWRPADTIGFEACCNGDAEHRILAELCLFVAERWSGVIDMDGYIRWLADDPTNGINIVEFPNDQDSDQKDAATKIVYLSPAALRRWMEHEAFHMVK